MTRRVRFSPFVVAGAFAAAMTLAGARSAPAVDVPLVLQPPVTTNVMLTLAVSAADIDGDGDKDILSASFDDDKVAWYENVGGDGSTWTPHTILTAFDTASFVSAADLDRDGDQDLFAASWLSGLIVRLENVAGDGSIWASQPIGAFGGAETVVPADVDGDGDVDALVASRFEDTVAWIENVGGTGARWVPHVITTLADGAEAAVGADVDGDGDIDALSASLIDDTIAWYENTAGNGTRWTRRLISGAANGANFLVAADVDGDGDPDAVSSSLFGHTVAWHENVLGDGSLWTDRLIMNVVRPNSVAAVDSDGDGDQDVLSSSGPDDKVAWYENTAGDGSLWTMHTITTRSNNTASVFAADVDGDADPDVLSGAFNDIEWYRNESIRESACFVARPALSTAATAVVAGSAADVDGDGDQDALSAWRAGTVAWHENVAGNGSSWTTRPITTAAPGAYAAVSADVDGDGDADVLSASGSDNTIAWHENAGNGSAWTPRTITTGALSATAVLTADVDRDGDVDAVSASFDDDKIAWYENAAGDGSVWTTRTIDTSADGAHAVFLADVDADGDVDVLSSSFLDDTVAWYENTAANGSAWTAHTISTTASGTVSVHAADMDRDGDQDVLATWHTGDTVAWYENTAGNGSVWTPRLISTAADGAESVFAADVDRDGDMDVLAASFLGNAVTWYENTAGNGTTWVARTLSTTAAGASEVVASDVDGDGDTDVFATSAIDHTVAWHENRAGQVSLTAIDTAPPTANNGELAAMLRIDVVHLGRAGDHDLELASLALLFEEAPENLLTTAEGNALVESLRVYRDANGNGAFDPSDALVTSVTELVLASGIQVVPFTDSDPNVQVAFGSPRTYFVVVELTANASQQAPHQFQLTHLGLGPSASVAEDRGFDSRLRLACPADVSSSIKQVVPVELMGFSVE